MWKRIIVVLAVLALGGVACESDADVASRNLSVEAEQFRIFRRIVFVNGITDEYLLEIQGFCSVETAESSLKGAFEVTCKLGEGQFKKHWLGLSDNVTYFVEQLESANVSTQRYKVIFKPSTIIPDPELT